MKLFKGIAILMMAVAGNASANWQGTVNSSWANMNNWSFQIPTSNMDAYILFSSNDPEVSTGTSAQCRNLYLPADWMGAGSVSMTVSGGTLNAVKIYCGSDPSHNSTLLLTGGEVTCSQIFMGENGVLDIAGGQLTITDPSARMAVRLWIDQGKIIGYGGTGRIQFGNAGTALVLSAEQTHELAQSPNPPDLATQIASGTSTQLTWTAGAAAVSHTLYWSTHAAEVIDGDLAALAGNQSGTVFGTPVLDANTVYYWRVDELSGTTTNRGDIWSFRTDDPDRTRPSLGIIRWDMYSGMAATQAQELGYLPGDYGFLAPTQWNWRAPFFCRYTNDVLGVDHSSAVGPLWFNYPNDFSATKQATEQEIAFAGTAGAGVDYWIFGTLPAAAGGNGWGLYWNLDAFLESERLLEINYAMMYRLDSIQNVDQLDVAISELVWHAQQSNYQTVLEGRPIIYFIDYKKLSETLGDPADGSTVINLAQAVQSIREAFSGAGLANPYLVASAVPAHAYNESNWIDGAGFDAGSDYRGAYGGTVAGTLFSELGANVEPYWDLNAANLSAALVPTTLCGADSRPRLDKGFGGPWFYFEPVPGDLTALMDRAMNYIRENPVECEANTFTMYSWNEHSEGGFLCPLIGESPDYIPDTWRLDEVGAAINAYSSPQRLVFVRADGVVFSSETNVLSPRRELDLTTNLVVAAATEGTGVFVLTELAEVIFTDLNWSTPTSVSVGSFEPDAGNPCVGIDVKEGVVFVLRENGQVYKNFSTTPEGSLAGDLFVDIAVKSATEFRGLYIQDGLRAWTRDEDNTFHNYANNFDGSALCFEQGAGYYILRSDGLIYGPTPSDYIGSSSADAVDLTVNRRKDFYTVSGAGSVRHLVEGGSSIQIGSVEADNSAFVAIDWVEEFRPEEGFDYSFDENDNFEGWDRSGGIAGFSVSGGTIHGEATTADPQFMTESADFNGSAVSMVAVRLRVSVNGVVQFYWHEVGGTYSAAKYKAALYSGNGDWQIVFFNPSAESAWTDYTIQGLRIDPTGTFGATFEVDWIRDGSFDADWDGLSNGEEGSADTDGDGTPDYLDEDSDGDGFLDRFEHTVGTDSKNPDDHAFVFEGAIVLENDLFTLSLTGLVGRLYGLMYSPSLTDPQWTPVDQKVPFSEGQLIPLQDSYSTNQAGYYRVDVEWP